MQFELANRLIHNMLINCHRHKWTAMGFGMIRTYLDEAKRWRVNVWTDALKVPNVSTIHNHPWDFNSLVISGAIVNRAYYPVDFFNEHRAGDYEQMRIVTGEGGGPASKPERVQLYHRGGVTYLAGRTYAQQKDVLHETIYRNGTVTVNDRSPPTPEHTAIVAWPAGTAWVDAKPRDTTMVEVATACHLALSKWDHVAR